MNRRTLLTTLGGAIVPGFADCLGGNQSAPNPSQQSNASNDGVTPQPLSPAAQT
jgi:hypothetical protein